MRGDVDGRVLLVPGREVVDLVVTGGRLVVGVTEGPLLFPHRPLMIS